MTVRSRHSNHNDSSADRIASPPALQRVAANAATARYARRGVPMTDRVIRVLLVDDHTIFREGLRGLLRSVPDVQVVGEASGGHDALTAVGQYAPDVVLMDLDMPGGDGATATREIAQLPHPPKVLILTMHAEEERLIPLLEGGASGYLAKDAAEREVVDAIRAVAAGEVYVRPSVARLLAANARPRVEPDATEEARRRLALLSRREQSVLRHTAEGYSGVEIAKLLGITPKTVDTYKTRIAQKLGFSHRTDYVRFALRVGLLEDFAGRPMADVESPLHRQPEP